MEARELVNKMTLEEKASLLCGESFFGSREFSKYNLKRIQFLDGGTGMNFEQLFTDLFVGLCMENGFTHMELDNATRFFFDEEKLTPRELELRDLINEKMEERLGGFKVTPGCYPPGIFLGSTWNKEVIELVGEALGEESKLYGIDCLLGTPNINLLRDPRNGRFFEGYSEDPYLTGELGSKLVAGVEKTGVASNVKHYAANNLEINRSGINQNISKRALMELYLPHFKKCLSEGAATIMTSYPSINGVPCVNDEWLLRDILREEFGFEGVNMTDWGACTGDSGDSVNAGVDLFMPGPWSHETIVNAVNDGRLSMERLDEACIRMVKFINKCNAKSELSFEEYFELGENASYSAAKEGIVMLKNDGVFPVDKTSEFVLFGPDDIRICGGGSAQVFTDRRMKMSEAFPGIKSGDFDSFKNENTVAIVVCSLEAREGVDRITLDMDLETIKVLDELIKLKKEGARGRIALILNTPGPVDLMNYIDSIDSIFAVFYPGSNGVKALRDIFYGDINPSGKLTFTWPLRIEDMPSYLHYPDGFTSYYGEGIFVGYRGYEKSKIKPLFPFGFGLSYSDFEISNAGLNKDEFTLDDEVKISFELENKGSFDGSEVVQIYVSDPFSRKIKPIKELKAFGKYFLKSGEKIKGELSFKIRDISSFDEDLNKFIVEDGEYEVLIGNSSENIALKVPFRVSDGDVEYRLGINTSVRELMEYPDLYDALKNEIREKGLNEISLIMAERYTPADTIAKIYENAGELTSFISMCTLYKKP